MESLKAETYSQKSHTWTFLLMRFAKTSRKRCGMILYVGLNFRCKIIPTILKKWLIVCLLVFIISDAKSVVILKVLCLFIIYVSVCYFICLCLSFPLGLFSFVYLLVGLKVDFRKFYF